MKCLCFFVLSEVRGQLTFVSYDGISIPYDENIGERGSTSYQIWEDRLISEVLYRVIF